jgi:hypothetical protein
MLCDVPGRPGLVWITIFRQSLPHVWSKVQGATESLSPEDPDAANFSILHFLEGCRSDDNGLFTLMYRDEHEGQFVVWEQSSNPATTSDKVSGFRVLHWGRNCSAQKVEERSRFRGLALSRTGKCLMDGNPGQENWWFCVGAHELRDEALPGIRQAREKMASRTELLVAVAPEVANALAAKARAALPLSSPEKAGSTAEVRFLAKETLVSIKGPYGFNVVMHRFDYEMVISLRVFIRSLCLEYAST